MRAIGEDPGGNCPRWRLLRYALLALDLLITVPANDLLELTRR